ncbi:MAG: Crp/Fnr family transcriptional regulator [Bacteroidales bacterium]|nr:Crp/Fnr family transcriptional regulator [Bacteroidales bacterium]MDE6080975.1 Crp/Fnr family transcriptional regulator [Muribaculaceae bacterium]
MNLRCITREPFELPAEIVDYLEENSEIVTFRKNETILPAGMLDAPFYFLSAGLARLYYPPLHGEEREETILFGEAGNIAGSLSNFMLGLPAVFGVKAVTPVKAYRIAPKIIRDLYQSNHIFCKWIMELALLQIAHLEIRHTYFTSKDPYERFINFIRFKPKSYLRRVPGYMIASYLDISPTEYSKVRERYDAEHLNVAYDKEFLDAVGLTGFAPEE